MVHSCTRGSHAASGPVAEFLRKDGRPRARHNSRWNRRDGGSGGERLVNHRENLGSERQSDLPRSHSNQ